MDIQQLNRTDAEKVFMAIKNVSGATMTTNTPVNLACTGNSVDGISAIKPVAASFPGWVGIINQDIADAGYGRSQTFGYRNSVLLSHEGTSVTVTIGDCLHMITGNYGLNTSTVQALSTMCFRYIICAQSQTISAAAYCKGIIRCL